MKAQDCFDILVKGMRKQNKRCTVRKARVTTTRVFNKQGLMNPCGMLIKDYRQEIEDKKGPQPEGTPWNFKTWLRRRHGFLSSRCYLLISKFCDLHDNKTPSQWEAGFASIAAAFGLEYKKPKAKKKVKAKV